MAKSKNDTDFEFIDQQMGRVGYAMMKMYAVDGGRFRLISFSLVSDILVLHP